MNRYNVSETNPIPEGFKEEFFNKAEKAVDWTTKGLKIVRLRLLSDPGFPFWDISYCYGILDNEPVVVTLPFNQLPKRNMYKAIIHYAKQDSLYAKGTGIFNAISTLN